MPRGYPRNSQSRENRQATRFTHLEDEEEFPAERLADFEELLADGLFNLWLSEKGFKKIGKLVGGSCE